MSRFFVASLAVLAMGCTTETGLTDDTVAAFGEPTLTLEDPNGGDWLPAGNVTVHGTASNLSEVKVNGVAAKLNGTDFSASLNLDRGVNVIEAQGIDGNGDRRFIKEAVLAGQFADPGLVVDDAINVRVNRPGLDFLMGEVGGMIKADDIAESVSAINPVYSDSYGLFGWDAVTVQADIGWLWFDKLELQATPTPGILEVRADLPNLDVWVPVSGDIVGIDFNVDVWLEADHANITAWLAIDVDADGNLVVDLAATDVALKGFRYDTSLLPGEIESFLLVDTVKGVLEDKLEEEITTMVPPMLEEQLGALDLSFETEMMGKQVAIEAGFAKAAVDYDGIQLIADLNVNVPGATEYAYAGFLKADREKKARPHRHTDIALGLSDDLLNRILFEVWRGGLLEMTLSTEDGSLEPVMLAPLGAEAGTITISAVLPPVIVEKDDGLQAQVGELLVTIDAPGSKLGDHVELAVNLFAGVQLGIKSGNLGLELTDAELDVVVRDNSWAGVSNETLSDLLGEMLPVEVLLGLANLDVPLPELGGIGINKGVTLRDDSGVHTLVDIDLN